MVSQQVVQQIKPSAVTAQDPFQKHIEKFGHIHFVVYYRVMGPTIEIIGVDNALPSADAFFRDLYVCRKATAHFRIQEAGDCQGIVDHTADEMFPLPVEIKVEFRDLADKCAFMRIQSFDIG